MIGRHKQRSSEPAATSAGSSKPTATSAGIVEFFELMKTAEN